MIWKNVSDYKGWRRRGLAMLLGLFSALALPPLYLLPLLIPSFSGLFLLICGAGNKKQAFMDGWWWGLGYFTAGLYWICISLYVEPEKFAWLTPFALFGLPSVLAIYAGIAAAAVFFISVGRKAANGVMIYFSPIILATIFTVSEYLRAHLFTGFPWNLIGYTWTVSDITLQAASFAGIYGLSWITVFVSTTPALFILSGKPVLPNIASVILVLSMVLFGWWRLEHNPIRYSDVKIRIVQANIAQNIKWSEGAQNDILNKYAGLTSSPGLSGVNMVIWPEAALPYYINVNDGAGFIRNIASILPENSLLITGGLRAENNANNSWQAWNSMFVINHDGNIIAQYDKHHLVPFGEFIPFRNILPVENISGGHGDFSAGNGPATIKVNNLPSFSPLICYESIFPDEVINSSDKPKWLLNITNDAWFGMSSGPYQSLQMSRVRAVENKMPVIRAANTGISAVIDSLGRIILALPLERDGTIDSYLPLAAE